MNEDAIARLAALSPGDRTNAALYELLLKPRFLGYFTFFEPIFAGVEFGDSVLISGDTAFLFEAKTRSVPREADIGWLREKIGEAIKQLNSRARRLRGGGIKLRNEWRGELEFDPSKVKHIYGIVVLAGQLEPFEWREVADEEFREAEIPIQVYSLFDLAELLRFHDTAIDLTAYFELRHEFERSRKLYVGKEKETFFSITESMAFLLEQEGQTPSDALRQAQYEIRRANVILNSGETTGEGQSEWASSQLLDLACEPLERLAPSGAAQSRANRDEHEKFLRTVGAVAGMSRSRRSKYGEKWLSASREAISESRVATRSSRSPSRKRGYLFLAWPLGKDPTEAEIGEMALAELGKRQADGVSSMLAIGASGASVIATQGYLESVARRIPIAEPEGDLVLAPIVCFVDLGSDTVPD